MSDYSKLKNYLNETRNETNATTSINDGLNNIKSSVLDFFSNKNENSVKIDLKDDQMDSWFKKADEDNFCPTLVSNL
jgi:hypothetical protein